MVISITIPDNVAARVRDEFCEWHGFVQNGETKQQFVQRKLREYVKESVRLNESAKAQVLANANVTTNVESEINIS